MRLKGKTAIVTGGVCGFGAGIARKLTAEGARVMIEDINGDGAAAMAAELAPAGIRVNALNPVAGETPLLARLMGEDTPERRARFLATIPLGRFSTPEDLGNAAVFLCSDEASMIIGVCVEVDGGRFI